MREIHVHQLTDAVGQLAQEASYRLPADVVSAFHQGLQREVSPLGKSILGQLIENANIAEEGVFPYCQDTGYAVVFLEIGQDVHFVGGDIETAIQSGIQKGYQEGYLRSSIVGDPLFRRVNTQTNTPGVVHYRMVPGDKVHVRFMPKGGGSENASQLKMLKPSDGVVGVKDFVVQVAAQAGPNACPPFILGVGIGGTVDKVMELAKEALFRPIGSIHPDPQYAALEKDIFEEVNALGIGPEGLGGKITTLAVHIEAYPAHIASLPVGVNVQCNAARSKTILI